MNSLALKVRSLGGLGRGLSEGETFCGRVFIDGGVSKTSKTLLYDGVAS